MPGQLVDVVGYRLRGTFVVLGIGQLQQLVGAAKALGQLADAGDDLVQRGALLAEILRALRIVPDVGIFEFAAYLFETFGFRLVVKDTP